MDNNKIGIKSFLSSIIIIAGLMVLTYVLTLIIPSGEYARIIDENGNTIIDVAQGFKYVECDFPFWKFLLSPFLILGAEGNVTIIAIIAFLMIIGGVFTSLSECKLTDYMIGHIADKYKNKRYVVLALIALLFMTLGSVAGSFEEVVPLVPLVIALVGGLGFNKYTGLAISLVAVCCGFACGVVNPFTVGVAQKLAGLPIFSGIWLRLLSFVFMYLLLLGFIYIYTKKNNVKEVNINNEYKYNKDYSKASLSFVIILGVGLLSIVCSTFVTFLQDYTMIIVALMFLVAGVVSCLVAKMPVKKLLKTFGKGIVNFLPAILMILMASSIRYILTESKTLDTVINAVITSMSGMPKLIIVFIMYALVLVLNFFIPSGSAKAFLLIPLITPIAQVFGISLQLCVLAYIFGDGFSNVFFPTNPVLLLSLSVSQTSYSKYIKWSYPFHIVILLFIIIMLSFGFVVGY